MSSVIWKQPMLLTDERQTFSLPEDFEVVHVATQGMGPSLWFRCDPDAALKPVNLRLIGTGVPFPDEWEHLGTCLDRPYVWHIMLEP